MILNIYPDDRIIKNTSQGGNRMQCMDFKTSWWGMPGSATSTCETLNKVL